MANPWFRMYSEFRSDPKIQTMSEAMQRRYIMLLCLKCDGELEKLSENEIIFALNLTVLKFSRTKLELIQKNLIQVENGKILIPNWDKRQYVSDTSRDRTKKWRDKKANVTSHECHGDVTVTAPDTDTDTDTDTDKELNTQYSCTEPENELASERDEIVIELPLNDKSLYPITESVIKGLSELYPAVDVKQEFRNMRGWLDASTNRRKTKRGIKKFYTGWIDRKQNQGYINQNKPSQGGNNGIGRTGFSNGAGEEFDFE